MFGAAKLKPQVCHNLSRTLGKAQARYEAKPTITNQRAVARLQATFDKSCAAPFEEAYTLEGLGRVKMGQAGCLNMARVVSKLQAQYAAKPTTANRRTLERISNTYNNYCGGDQMAMEGLAAETLGSDKMLWVLGAVALGWFLLRRK